jgi:hypothetical protein
VRAYRTKRHRRRRLLLAGRVTAAVELLGLVLDEAEQVGQQPPAHVGDAAVTLACWAASLDTPREVV